MDLAGQPVAFGEHAGLVMGRGEFGPGGLKLRDEGGPFQALLDHLDHPAAVDLRERDREVVRAQLEIYHTWYAEGGLSGLQTRFLQQEGSGKETFFVRVLGAEGVSAAPR